MKREKELLEININQEKEILDEINTLLMQIMSEINKCKIRLEKAPKGTLRTCSSRNTVRYYQREYKSDRTGKYLNKENAGIIKALSQKEYDLNLLEVLSNQQEVLEEIVNNFHPEKLSQIYDNLCDAKKKYVTPIMLSDEKYVDEWMKEEYEGLEFTDSDESEYITSNGIRVRSKSEIMIAEALIRHKIPFKYEYPLNLQGMGVVHPDFWCLNIKKRKVIAWEHFGMMSDESYSTRCIKKMEVYNLNGFVLGDNFICTFESANAPLGSKMIERMIELYL